VIKYIILLVISLFFSGCNSGIVKIRHKDLRNDKWYGGTGVVVSDNEVVTAYHVVDGDTKCKIKVSTFPRNIIGFKIQKYMLTDDNIEPIVLLRPFGRYKFFKKNIFKIGIGAPYKVITLRGTFHWKGYRAVRGDSGSAVVNIKGDLVGVVYGHRRKEPIFFRV